MKFDSSTFYANSPDMLIKAHKLLEAYIEDFAVKADMEAELLRKYREKRSECVKTARGASIPVSIMGDSIRGECAKEKEEYMKATSRKKEVLMNINATQEKIYTIRHLNRGVEGSIKTQ